jgi:hypothetical protein
VENQIHNSIGTPFWSPYSQLKGRPRRGFLRIAGKRSPTPMTATGGESLQIQPKQGLVRVLHNLAISNTWFEIARWKDRTGDICRVSVGTKRIATFANTLTGSVVAVASAV